jgi:hypothetical protein
MLQNRKFEPNFWALCMPRRRAVAGWAGCRFCKGKKGLPRASPNSVRCTASECTKALTRERKAAKELQVEPSEAAVPQQALESIEEMPDGVWVHELGEILGERCCRVRLLSDKRRRSGPRDSYQQEYLVRGTFLEDDGDEGEEDEEDVPEPNTYWVTEEALLQTIERADVKQALQERQEHVLEGLDE